MHHSLVHRVTEKNSLSGTKAKEREGERKSESNRPNFSRPIGERESPRFVLLGRHLNRITRNINQITQVTRERKSSF